MLEEWLCKFAELNSRRVLREASHTTKLVFFGCRLRGTKRTAVSHVIWTASIWCILHAAEKLIFQPAHFYQHVRKLSPDTIISYLIRPEHYSQARYPNP
jgi:hypothetical protein